jgi:DNA-binding NarL/FixJ family response regulator
MAMATEGLTDREKQILTLISEGWDTKDILEQLNIKMATFKTHLDHVFRALGAANRAHAVRLGMERGLIEYESRAGASR